MIKLTATALIHYISPVIQVTDRFQKRELILNDSWVDRENQEHPNYVAIEFSGDSMGMLDSFFPGQRVVVEAYVNGREYNGRYFNTIRGQSIRPFQPVSAPQPTAPAGYPDASGYPRQAPQQFGAPVPSPAYPQQMAPAYPQQTTYPPQTAYPPTTPAPAPQSIPQPTQVPAPQPVQQPAPQGQQYSQSAAPGMDQLPFTPQ